MIKQLSSLAIGVVLAMTTNDAFGQADPRAKEALERLPPWRNSVVVIRIDCPGQDPFRGTGVVINNNGYVLTAAHVGKTCLNVTSAKVGAVRSPYAAPVENLSATLVARRVDGDDTPDLADINATNYEDLALWKISDFATSGLKAATVSTRFQVPSDEVFVVGFSSLPFSYPTSPHNQLAGLTVYRTWLSSVAGQVNDTPYRLHYPGYTLGGVSGGPVFDAAGELVGIHSTRESTNIRDLITTNCTVDSFKNCATIVFKGPTGATVTQPIGVNYGSVKSVLDNYSWATSIYAVPADWFTRQ